MNPIAGVSKLPKCHDCGHSAAYRTYSYWGAREMYWCNRHMPEEGRRVLEEQEENARKNREKYAR